MYKKVNRRFNIFLGLESMKSRCVNQIIKDLFTKNI